eukprot:CAMPEP_0202078550 /NCGR_PEP_ID=MMETSP0964-20121228/6004_1 /ASSEMBLY_ACC=CAM_ASM_000500 /TAXON_ID=4773 /ORGANISM="Schizochytrium aggregatum, Strain ATCC28209" /LENGTH=103 /DNA_ID=CAMNT_0048645863 /DNA_START=75 /DNA_END=383 /DNA_ORIENTATION=-
MVLGAPVAHHKFAKTMVRRKGREGPRFARRIDLLLELLHDVPLELCRVVRAESELSKAVQHGLAAGKLGLGGTKHVGPARAEAEVGRAIAAVPHRSAAGRLRQ